MSARFAKSPNIKELWKNLAAGADLVEEVSRWDLSRYYPDSAIGEYCRHGSFLDDIDRFDPVFFNISGLEANYMDPQQRLFLEECWKALEDAGYAGGESAVQRPTMATTIGERRCGVYVGWCGVDYGFLLGDNPPPQAHWGTTGSVIPARIAYFLDLHGPAVAVDTACSSSLVAVHLACRGLLAGEMDMALAGGVSIQTTPASFLTPNKGGMLSHTGRCYTFDERADGFVLGEGVGVVVLKRLADAVAARDNIYGVIRGSALNQDGKTNGITAPSARSQERLAREVYETFNIRSRTHRHGRGPRHRHQVGRSDRVRGPDARLQTRYGPHTVLRHRLDQNQPRPHHRCRRSGRPHQGPALATTQKNSGLAAFPPEQSEPPH